MKATIKVSPRVIIEAEGNTHTEVFEQAASMQEVFGVGKCDKCKCEDLRFVVRTDDEENKYYELHCQNWKCRARLSFGQNKTGGTLYPRRKETKKQSIMGGSVEANGWLPDNGWIRWNKEKNCSE